MRVRVGGLTFDGEQREPGSDTFLIAPKGLTGWLGGRQVRRDEEARPNAHGAFWSPGFLPQAVCDLKGSVIASSAAARDSMCQQLTGLLAGGGKSRMVVDEDRGTTWRDVGLLSQADVTKWGDRFASFSISFWSADPAAYGESRTFANGAAVFHYGNFESSPVATVVGPKASGYTVSAGPHSHVVSAALPSGSTDVVDLATGWVMRNGSLLVDGVSKVDTWAVQPGVAPVHSVSGSTGSATFSITDRFV